MFVGHYGVAFAAKRMAPPVTLWELFVAVQLLDVVWAPLVLLGIEKVRIVPGITATNPLDLYHMPYTHSLVAALMWSVAAYVGYRLARPRGGRIPALTVAAAVLSHWVLDLLVHRPDLPLYDDTAKVGLGLWNFPRLAFGLEAACLFAGIGLYLGPGLRRGVATLTFGLVMLATQAYVFFGPPPVSDVAIASTALVSYATFAGVAWLLERKAERDFSQRS